MQRIEGVALSDDDAAELVAALDALERLAAARGARLSPRLVELRRGLSALAEIRVSARADVRIGVAEVAEALTVDMGAVDTATAAQALGITPDGVRYLCRSGRLPAYRRAGRWWINAAELHAVART
ncbi:helix-turn-helix domain-containing protein [Nocardia farcinica]|uniref:helix-turn-helix domain-containing protein n=1 Tax=Nocardia farcinica TaxID=37329 RepID=UPI0024571140|nr:helix-turn-helix domain-containing protein [Nocardia farcinica]